MKSHNKRWIILWLIVVIGLMWSALPVTAQPVELPSGESAPTGVTAYVTSGTVNVRSGPGTGYGIVGRANEGQQFDVTGKNAEATWWRSASRPEGLIFGSL
jgi:uncharacterized protein YgiM (DUF1202 family)